MAQYLEAEFVDPADYITILPNGNVDPRSYAVLGDRLYSGRQTLCDRRILRSGYPWRGENLRVAVPIFLARLPRVLRMQCCTKTGPIPPAC